MSQKENKKKYLEEYRVTLRIFESVFYKSLIRACSFDNSLAASQNARSYVQTIDHRALRICKKRIQKVLMLAPFMLINIFSYLLSDSYNGTLFKSLRGVYVIISFFSYTQTAIQITTNVYVKRYWISIFILKLLNIIKMVICRRP